MLSKFSLIRIGIGSKNYELKISLSCVGINKLEKFRNISIKRLSKYI